ncbi:hypothetical protein BH09SUM1_BH09SUM1_09780 [soil metagenome]
MLLQVGTESAFNRQEALVGACLFCECPTGLTLQPPAASGVEFMGLADPHPAMLAKQTNSWLFQHRIEDFQQQPCEVRVASPDGVSARERPLNSQGTQEVPSRHHLRISTTGVEPTSAAKKVGV